jgi:endonuclease YncB( thermonuclease family)
LIVIKPHQYVAVVPSPAFVHDGDTFTDMQVDLGFDAWMHRDVRLVGMNARELDGPGGAEARQHLLGILWPKGGTGPVEVGLISVKYDKFGNRSIGDVIVNGESLSTLMIRDGYAAAWNGRGDKPVPPWPIPA